MIGIDTNILVRYLMNDDPLQSPQARRFVERELSEDNPGYISHIVLCELTWVASRRFGLSRADMAAMIGGLLRAIEIVIEDEPAVIAALDDFMNSSAGFADLLVLHSAKRAGCAELLSFDKDFARIQGVRLLA